MYFFTRICTFDSLGCLMLHFPSWFYDFMCSKFWFFQNSNFVGPIIAVGVAMPNDLISEFLKKYMGKYMACTVFFQKYKYTFCTVLYFCQKDVYCTFFKKYVYFYSVLTAALNLILNLVSAKLFLEFNSLRWRKKYDGYMTIWNLNCERWW